MVFHTQIYAPKISTSNRGMALEALINLTNETYRNKGIAVVYKRPTPIHIVSSSGTRITSAFLEAASTVDYEGVYHGFSLQFEAKSTREKTRFPLDNVHEHQVAHMRACMAQGAIVFALVEFSRLEEVFYLPGRLLIEAWDKRMAGGPASIPYQDFERQCERVESGRGVPLDYLPIVDKVIAQKKEDFQ